MARPRVTLDEDREAPFSKGVGLTNKVSWNGQWDWGYVLRMRNADDTADIELLRVNEFGQVIVGGVPVQGVGASQTPWVSDINGAGFDLNNAGNISMESGAALSVGGKQIMTSDGSSTYLRSENPGAVIFQGGAVELGRISSPSGDVNLIGKVGLGVPSPFYKLDILGDVNITGTYRVNGVPITSGGGQQTPWTSNIDAANYHIFNLGDMASTGNLTLSKPSGVRGGVLLSTDYSPRWVVAKSDGPESGGNAGSDYYIYRYDDTGSSLGSPFQISRATGLVSLANGLTVVCITSLNGGANIFGNTNVNGNVNITGVYQVNGATVSQTPWTGDIDAAGYSVYNLDRISVGMPSSTDMGATVHVYSPTDSSNISFNNTFTGTDPYDGFRVGINEKSAYLINSVPDGDISIENNGALCLAISPEGSVVIGSDSEIFNSAYRLNVDGDCNITGTFRVNGIPISGGGAVGMTDPTTTLGDLIVRGAAAPATRLGVGANGQVLCADSTQLLGMKWVNPTVTAQTPWTSDHNAAGFRLTGIREIVFNDSTGIRLWGIYSSSDSAPFLRAHNNNAAGVAFSEFMNSASKYARFGIYGTSYPFAPSGSAGNTFLRYANSLIFINESDEIRWTLGQNGNVAITGGVTVAGNVGIGVGNSTYPLAVSSVIHVTNSGNPALFLTDIAYSRTAKIDVWQGNIRLGESGVSDVMVVNLASRRVGIGTPDPSYHLTVIGDVNISGTYRVNGNPISSGGVTSRIVYDAASRTLNATYRNTSGKPMMVTVTLSLQAASGSSFANAAVKSDGANPPTTIIAQTLNTSTTTQHYETLTFWVLPNDSYRIDQVQALVQTGSMWVEWT